MGKSAESQMHINLFLSAAGHHEAAWRLPEVTPSAQLTFEHYRQAAQVAERARLDSIFFADMLSVGANVTRQLTNGLEPISVLSAVSAVTTHVGLIATASTSYNEPYNLARRFATLDHLSGGRAGWNIVTSASQAEARNFGLDGRADHADRYRRATEFVGVVNKLWDSWEDGALVGDKESGLFADPERTHAIDHVGDFFRVAGPLSVPRSPQGRPVLVQAGTSNDGITLGARYAEAIFTAQRTIAEGKAFYDELKGRAVQRFGRHPDHIKILPGISPFLGSTEAEARRVEEELLDLIQTEFALRQLSNFLDYEVTEDLLDQQLPPIPGEDDIEGHKSRSTLLVKLAREEDLSVRQLLGRIASGRGHRTFVGTPEQLADDLELWFRSGAADGFNFMPPSIPTQMEVFADHVIPILQRRGLFREEYEGTTLRENLGLPRPESRYAREAETVGV
jgi:FMN-dependent oxidoreductase (nitrilotriacetate monooxygenase family)